VCRQDDSPSVSTDIEGIPPNHLRFVWLLSKFERGTQMTTAGLIAAPMVALAALYVDTRCTRCGLYRHDHVRGDEPGRERTCPTLAGRRR
jgi:hypothetical protein